MIYITGDTHGEQTRFLCGNIEGEMNFTKDDYLIVCGDFGYVFKADKMEDEFLDSLGSRPYTILFCDGNHENFAKLNEYPVEEWCGGKVHRIRKNILHLMRGQVFLIDGKRFFTMGGAYSIDKYMRTRGVSWWSEEIPTSEEYKEASKNLDRCGRAVDYIITHTAPTEIIRRMGHVPDMHDAELTGFLEWIMYEVGFRKWFFGHWHTDKQIDERFRALWFDVEKV